MRLQGKRAVIVIAEGYAEPDMWTAYYRFLEEGAEVIVAGPEKGKVFGQGLRGRDGRRAEITHTLEEVEQLPCDILFLPGGVWSPMKLRVHAPTLRYIRTQMEKQALVCAMGHAPWILISAEVVKGRRLCGLPDTGDDIQNAGGTYVTQEGVARDGNLLTATAFSQMYELMRQTMAAFDA